VTPVGKNEIFTQAGTAELVALLNQPRSWRPADGTGFFLGVDLGTAYAVSVVIDGAGEPAAGLVETARLAREGLIVDFVGARELVRRHLEQYREAGYRFRRAATSYPPGTEEANARAVANILMGEGLAPAPLADEPSAANLVLGLENGVIVDVGGGTTGMALVEGGRVVDTADEPTGGWHFTLVIAGDKGLGVEEAEAFKLEPGHAEEAARLTLPVMEKIGALVARYIGRLGARPPLVVLIGGTSRVLGLDRVVEEAVGAPARVAAHPELVTPLGVALSALASGFALGGGREGGGRHGGQEQRHRGRGGG